MNIFCIKNVNRDNFHDVYLFLKKINCYIPSSVWRLNGMPPIYESKYKCDIFINKPTDVFESYWCGGCPFYCWSGHLRPDYKQSVIDANDLKGGGKCITNHQELTTTIILN